MRDSYFFYHFRLIRRIIYDSITKLFAKEYEALIAISMDAISGA